MMRALHLCVLFISCCSWADQRFYISELFANKPGRASNKEAQWIELYNRGDSALSLNHVLLEIWGPQSEKLVHHELSLTPDLVFEQRLLIAQNENLDSDFCLNNNIPLVVLPSFNLNHKNAKICVTLNEQERDCITLGLRDRFLDGVALYRHHEGKKVNSWWLSEPCHLGKGIFATPGLAPKACVSDVSWFSEIIVDCDHKTPNLPGPIRSYVPTPSFKPLLAFDLKGALTLKDDDPSDWWRLSFCASPPSSRLVCHEAQVATSIIQGPQNDAQAIAWSSRLGSKLTYKVRDISGQEHVLPAAPKPASAGKLADLKINTVQIPGQIQVELLLSEEILPINYWVKDRDQSIIKSGAFIESGRKELSLKYASGLKLAIKNLHEHRELPLSSDQEPRGCSTRKDLWALELIALLLFTIFRVRRSFSN